MEIVKFDKALNLDFTASHHVVSFTMGIGYEYGKLFDSVGNDSDVQEFLKLYLDDTLKNISLKNIR